MLLLVKVFQVAITSSTVLDKKWANVGRSILALITVLKDGRQTSIISTVSLPDGLLRPNKIMPSPTP